MGFTAAGPRTSSVGWNRGHAAGLIPDGSGSIPGLARPERHDMELVLSCGWLAIVGWLIWRAFRARGLLQVVAPAAPAGADAPMLAVIVPVRNEAANIGACLDGLQKQDYPAHRLSLIVVDDHSTDATAALVASAAARTGAADPRIALLRSPPLPAGWIGKSHACCIGAQAVPRPAEWLCFLDADVRPRPALLSSALRAAQSDRIDLLSLAPRQELASFAERLLLPCGLLLLGFRQDIGRACSPRRDDDVTATGQFMLIRRGVYEAVGGHAPVRGEICEDLHLARLIKRTGFAVALRSGERLIAVRMYSGWRSLWPGLAKNLVEMLGGPAATIATAVVAVVLAWSAVLLPAIDAHACAVGTNGACVATALAAAGAAAVFALHLAATAYFAIPWWYGLIFPLGYTLGALIAADSVIRRSGGRVTWKGRSYPASARMNKAEGAASSAHPAQLDELSGHSPHVMRGLRPTHPSFFAKKSFENDGLRRNSGLPVFRQFKRRKSG
jgi:chlorobactene glucosyltransferase